MSDIHGSPDLGEQLVSLKKEPELNRDNTLPFTGLLDPGRVH